MKTQNYIDLHNHSIASIDGTYKPNELIDIALNSGIKYMAITDHDTVKNVEEGLNYCKDKDITLIPGIEISAYIEDYPLHITAYGIDYKHPGFKQRKDYVDKELIEWRNKFIQKSLDFGFKFNVDEVYNQREDHAICEELVGQVIFNDPRNNNDDRLKEFRPGGKYSDNPTFNFYKVLTTPGNPLHVPYTCDMPIEEASKLIHEAGGKMFLAHPNHNISKNIDILEKIISYDLDGIEVFSSYHDKQTVDFYYEQAKKYNLYMSVGSDFHGASKPAIKMGSIDYDENELIKTLKFIGAYNG